MSSLNDGQGGPSQAGRPRVRVLQRRRLIERAAVRAGAEQRQWLDAGVFPTTSGKWQATIRVERDGKKVRRNVGSFDTKEEAALQRALALQGTVEACRAVLRLAGHGAQVRSMPAWPVCVPYTLTHAPFLPQVSSPRRRAKS